jgi:hypothetical protein
MPPPGGRLVRPINPRSRSALESATRRGEVSTVPLEVEKRARGVLETLVDPIPSPAGASEQATLMTKEAASAIGTTGRTISSSHDALRRPRPALL